MKISGFTIHHSDGEGEIELVSSWPKAQVLIADRLNELNSTYDLGYDDISASDLDDLDTVSDVLNELHDDNDITVVIIKEREVME